MQESDDQEVVRTIGDLKRLASFNWTSGYIAGVISIIVILGIIFGIGLHYDI